MAGRAVTVLALCCAIGLHWLVLQSVAWTAMLVDYSQQKPLRVAISETFDGDHPCSLCHAVNKGTQSQKESDNQAATPRIDLICTVRTISLMAEFAPWRHAPYWFPVADHTESPPVPPPRELVA